MIVRRQRKKYIRTELLARETRLMTTLLPLAFAAFLAHTTDFVSLLSPHTFSRRCRPLTEVLVKYTRRTGGTLLLSRLVFRLLFRGGKRRLLLTNLGRPLRLLR